MLQAQLAEVVLPMYINLLKRSPMQGCQTVFPAHRHTRLPLKWY